MAQLPTQSQFGDYSEWPGRDVLDSGGQRLGGVREIYLDRETGRPEWVLVDVEGTDARFVPLADATVEGRSITVAHSAEKIKAAPGIGAEPRIDQSEERRLYAHYGLGYSEDDSDSGLPSTDAPPAPTGWGAGEKDEPSWQARGGDTPPSDTADAPPSSDAPAPFSTPDEQPSNAAPPPADPPSPAEIEEAHIPEEPPAASDRASAYETAPFGAVAPPADAESTSAVDDPLATSPDDDALTADDDNPPEGAVDAPPLFDDPAGPIDEPPIGTLDSPPADAPVPTLAGDAASSPPVTADTPEADDSFDPSGSGTSPALSPHAAAPESDPIPKASKPSAATPPPEEVGAAGGALERVKRDPKKVALAAVGAAVLFFIIRRLR